MLIKHSIIEHRKAFYVHTLKDKIKDGAFVNSPYSTDVIILIR